MQIISIIILAQNFKKPLKFYNFISSVVSLWHLVRIRILWLKDPTPDPGIFVSDLQDYNLSNLSFFVYYLLKLH
jgi:hypothetical protein